MLIVALAASGLGLAAHATDLLRRPELSTVDLRFSVRGRAEAPRDIVVVQVDDVTFGYLQQRWPFPRRIHAQVIDRLRAAGARVIGYDVQFTEPTDASDDNALINSVAAARPVVLATTEVDTRGQANVFGGDQVLRPIGARAGNALLAPDPDAIYRRLSYSISGLKTFAVAIVETATGRSVPASPFAGGSVPIDFVGPRGTIPTISMSQVLQGRFSPNLFRGKIVIVGPSAPSLQDVHPTPYGHDALMSGVELQANAVATILHNVPLTDAPDWVDRLLIVLLGVVAPLVSLRISSGRALLIVLLLGAAYTIGVQVAFNSGSILSLTYPLMALGLGTFGTLAVSYLVEAFERERVRTLFGRFVPAGVVDEVLARTDDNLRLGAVERECTVLFCDLRGFTSFSETQPAQRTLDVVNFYLDVMTEAILAAGGTLISYMGDGIMALFGAPLEQPDHAARAVAAAREMMGPRLERFNAWLREQGFDSTFRMGIGLNTGPVMAGNIGSEQRVEYTAIGDTTNTASRLEGMTKGTPFMLFISESTRAGLTPPPDDLVFVDEFELRGRRARLKVWAVGNRTVAREEPAPATELGPARDDPPASLDES